MRPIPDLRVYAVLDPARCRARSLPAMAAAAARGGATLVQLRDKRPATREVIAAAEAVLAALRPFGTPLIVNDRVDVALAVAAAGVHLGQQDMPPATARRLMGVPAIVGATVHQRREADAIDPAVVDYVGVGPVFVTASKLNEDPPIGPAGLAALIGHLRRRLPGFPCCAIAGVGHASAAEIVADGADGVAVISDIFMAEDVEAATRRLRLVVDQALAARQNTP